MLYEPSTLASIAYVLGQTLERDYEVNLGDRACIPFLAYKAGERISVERMDALWSAAVTATNDLLVGIKVGRNIEASASGNVIPSSLFHPDTWFKVVSAESQSNRNSNLAGPPLPLRTAGSR